MQNNANQQDKQDNSLGFPRKDSEGNTWKLRHPNPLKNTWAFWVYAPGENINTSSKYKSKTWDDAEAVFGPIRTQTTEKNSQRKSKIADMSDEDLAGTANTSFDTVEEKWPKVSNSFTEAIFQSLPEPLKGACDKLISQTEKEVFLVGAIGVSSGLLPNVYGIYDGKRVESNLYTYVLAPYGTGKGALTFAYHLGGAIHLDRKEMAKSSRDEYEVKNLKYEIDLADFRKSKYSGSVPPSKPELPKKLLLYIPSNNSKTGVLQLLDDNDKRAVIFETEADTIADALGQDYGNFSDALRNAFHHERISYNRRGNGGELVDMDEPRLSIVLSSTFDQLLKLIPTAANGLFSRFLFYNLPPDRTFRNVFDNRKRDYEGVFIAAGEEFQKAYKSLNQRADTPLEIMLTPQQQALFMDHFSDTKETVYRNYDENLGGSVNRLALICFRLCMIFTSLRAFETIENTSSPLTCSDQDFENAVLITTVLTKHAIKVYEQLPRPHQVEKKEREDLKFEAIKRAVEEKCGWDQIAKDWGFNSRQAANIWFHRTEKKRHK